MPAKNSKRKEHQLGESSPPCSKQARTENEKQQDDNSQSLDGADEDPQMTQAHSNAKETEKFGIVLREFYPPEMSNARCDAYNDGILERPIQTLQKTIQETAKICEGIQVKNATVHWFKTDLRLKDNKSLHAAYALAQRNNVPMICIYIMSPQDLTAHLSSPARVDLTLRTLQVMKSDLDRLDIPLYMETVKERRNIPDRIVELCQKWGASHIFTNLEYEVDELRREARLTKLCTDNGIAFETLHDTCVVPPGSLVNKSGKQYASHGPWYKAWLGYLKNSPEDLEILKKPNKNRGNTRENFKDLFDCILPPPPENKTLSQDARDHLKSLYPEGEHEALSRLDLFLKNKVKGYDGARDFPAKSATSVLSPYFACGALSSRTAVSMAKDGNKGLLDGGEPGIASWISEIAWRDFYKHVLVNWPFICMNKCFKPEYTNIEWEYNKSSFEAWCEGKTGYPIVDAAMRQLKQDAWMHNRTRMVVSSFLSKDLMIDWRIGERFFMEHLIDGDFASNHGGWGFGSGTGVDPMPYFRIFNPLRQSERFDIDGEYIRRYVPELRHIKDKAIHDPYGRDVGAIAKKNKYPEPIVEHSASRARALARYSKALGK